MSRRDGLFAGSDPFAITRAWLEDARGTEPNDPDAAALATVDASGLPDARIVLIRAVEGRGQDGTFLFYTNYDSTKGMQIEATRTAAFVMHWKTLRRQIRVRGTVSREDGPVADEYFHSRPLQSRIGAWASDQSRVLTSREALMERVARETERLGDDPPRPPHWGGYRIHPLQIEFWADGAFRLHDRFIWHRLESGAEAPEGAEIVEDAGLRWAILRLHP